MGVHCGEAERTAAGLEAFKVHAAVDSLPERERELLASSDLSAVVDSIRLLAGCEGIFGETAGGVTLGVLRKLLKEGADYIKIVASGGSTRTSDPNRASYTVAEPSRASSS